MGDDNELPLFNLVSERKIFTTIPMLNWSCVFDNELFVGIEEATSIRHAPLDAVYDGLALEEFGEFDIPGEINSAVTDRAPDGEIVIRTSLEVILIRVSLRTKESTIVECDKELSSIGSLTVIRVPGVLCTMREVGSDEASLAVFGDGRTEKIARGLGQFTAILPSASDPTDLSRAAAVDWNGFFAFGGKKEKLTDPVNPRYQTLVRVFRDVFPVL
eukprot:gnl/Chilomastix_cuspidata/2021.p2 GENE.gnl/Chilomastix_cuspidata/2021~~gnl/Chilomastix_cuspidata/2021.p2  ORF type:complete len:216 (-),score=58.12 gnl/Chilomastix_cuspidata/2021:1027-1674(-)